MKKFTKGALFVASLFLTTLNFQAQNQQTKLAEIPKSKSTTNTTHKALVASSESLAKPQNSAYVAGKSMALNTCTDLIEYVGNTGSNYITIGSNTNTSSTWEIGSFQVYPAYTGAVVGVQMAVAKYSTTYSPKLYVAIFDLDGFGQPDESSQLNVAQVTVTNTTGAFVPVTFTSPVTVSNGFAIGLYVLGQDSVKTYAGPTLPNVSPYYSYVYNSLGNMYSMSYYFNVNLNFLSQPIVTTSVNPTWLSAKTSTGCGIPVVYNFTNTTAASPAYATNTIITAGITRSVDFGDGTPVLNSFPTSPSPVTHSYTALGTFTAGYTQTYLGWTNNCVQTETILVVVDNPLPSFTYNTSGLTVNFTNTSTDMSTFTWNFGDLSTSTQTDPTHTFSSPGTYVVELEGTAACGTVKYSTSVVVTGSGVGIKENTTISRMIRIFPNPAANTLQISNQSQDALNSRIEILSSVGALVKVVNAVSISGTTSVDISDLSKGMYFIKLKSTQGDIVKSFVKE
ncbi:hypothetical protein CNR22_11105 [Sphingobacteriaceae bacterium]|nr:hypothetical protein CNR22_11105 [Sphingobacteriaceae bacterium]